MLIKSKTKLKKVIDKARGDNKKVLIKRGVFDIIHPGHISTIEAFNKVADVVIIMVASDALVKRRKGERRPINHQKQRAEVVDGLKGVDYVYIENTVQWKYFQKFLEYLQPDILAKTEIEPKWEKTHNGRTWKWKMFPEKSRPGFSTTAIINKIHKLR